MDHDHAQEAKPIPDHAHEAVFDHNFANEVVVNADFWKFLLSQFLPGALKRRNSGAQGAGIGYCRTMQDSLLSVKPYILSFPAFWPVPEKARISLVFYL